MKKLNKLKINEIAKNNLSHKEMKYVVGGGDGTTCSCSCYWADQGGSSSSDNCRANRDKVGDGSYSEHGENLYICWKA